MIDIVTHALGFLFLSPYLQDVAQIFGMEPTLQLQAPMLMKLIPSFLPSLTRFRSISSRSSRNMLSTASGGMIG